MKVMQTRNFRIQRTVIGLCCGALLAGVAALAADDQQLPEKQKQQNSDDAVNKHVKDLKPLAPRSFESGSSIPSAAPVLNPSSNTRLTKEALEELDRKHNWIFDTGQTSMKGQTPEEVFGVKEYGV